MTITPKRSKRKSAKPKSAKPKSAKPKSAKKKTRYNARVFHSSDVTSPGGLEKDDFIRKKNGSIVSKRRSAKGKKNKWISSVKKARSNLKIKGLVLVNGKDENGEGKRLYKEALVIHGKKT